MIRNRPTSAGAALGRELARLVDEAEPRARLVEPAIPPRCASCAFRAGPHAPNGSEATLGDALKCVLENVPFDCHEPARAGHPCSGWQMLQLAHPSAPGRCPWPFSDKVSIAGAVEPDQPAFPKSCADYAGDEAQPLDARPTL